MAVKVQLGQRSDRISPHNEIRFNGRTASRAMLVTSFGGQIMGGNGEFLVFMDAEDSSEGLVKAATRKKVYKCLEVC